MREKEYSEWMSKQGFDVLRHANCCKIAFNGGWESRQTEVEELQKRVEELQERINDSLEKMDAESSNSWGLWKEKACMYEQGASNAYEKSYWILKGEEND